MKAYPLLFSMIFTLALSACGDLGKVTFNEEEANWLKTHKQWDKALYCSDEKKLKIKEILKTEIALSKELDSLVRDIKSKFPESGIEFSSPTTVK